MSEAPIRQPLPVYDHPVELAILARLHSQGPQLVRQYISANTIAGAVYIARDKAKELFTEYRENPTLHNRHADAAASAIADAARRTILQQPPSGNRNLLMLVTGCPASGKTVSIGPEVGRRVEIEHETILTSYPRAQELIRQAIAAERFPIVRLHYTDDPRINVRRMILRALKFGRTVPLRYMAETYVGVPSIVNSLTQEFGSPLAIRVVNNSKLPEQADHHNDLARALAHVNRYTQRQALEAMNGELEELTVRHTIPSAILEEARRA